jgi:aminoglycoside 6-adenylyltransferase
MRNEEQVLKLILDFAQSEERIRAVMLNGSRLNIHAPQDAWQDYDIVFFIRDIQSAPYRAEQDWIKQFGELVIKQVLDPERVYQSGFQFLMQFKSGIRIDLSFRDIIDIELEAKDDSLSRILLDKDNLAPKLPPPNDSKYLITKPSKQEFTELLNEAWWIMPYIAKGLLRDELPYVKYMFDVVLMGCIRKLLCWYIGSEHNWSANSGYCEKWFKSYLPPDIYNEFVALFPTTNYDEIWTCLSKSGDFIRKIGLGLAERLAYPYNKQDDENVREFLRLGYFE